MAATPAAARGHVDSTLPMTPSPTRPPWPLVVMFAVAGAAHFVFPGAYAAIVPRWLPHAPLLVAVSGAAEIAGAAGLVPRATRRWAGMGLIALLAAVLPANVQMLVDAQRAGVAAWGLALLALRLPLQGFLMWWVFGAAVRPAMRDRASPPPVQPAAPPA